MGGKYAVPHSSRRLVEAGLVQATARLAVTVTVAGMAIRPEGQVGGRAQALAAKVRNGLGQLHPGESRNRTQ